MAKDKILIVDDTATSLMSLAEVVSRAGYEVICAKSGEKALEILDSLRPDLILLDVQMPGMDGLELCRRIKLQEPLLCTPVIFQSVADDSETKIEGLKAGAADFVSKPYQPDEILLRIRTHLELQSLQNTLEEMVESRTRQLKSEIRERRRKEKELKVSRQNFRKLGAHMQEVREQERKHIAREIHDALGQSLTVAQIELKRLKTSYREGRQDIEDLLDAVNASISEAADTARSISENLRPGMLDVLGLKPALENYLQRFLQATGMSGHADINIGEDLIIEDKHAIASFRIAQESLTNVARHAQASKVSVDVMANENGIILAVQDNGVGVIEPERSDRNSFGIQGMRERAEMLGGSLTLESEDGTGTRVEAFIPFKELNTDG